MRLTAGAPKERVIVEQLRAAALCAITSYGQGDPHGHGARPASEDSNPYTRALDAYDLGRIFSPAATRRQDAATTLGEIFGTVARTHDSPGQPSRRSARARWVAHELERLGHRQQAQRFRELAKEADSGQYA